MTHEVSNLGIQTITHSTPLVFIDVVTGEHWYRLTLLVQMRQFGDQGLTECRQRQRIFNGCRHIEDAKLKRIIEGVRAQIPPDLLPIINAPRLNQILHETIKLCIIVVYAWRTTAREALPDNRAIAT